MKMGKLIRCQNSSTKEATDPNHLNVTSTEHQRSDNSISYISFQKIEKVKAHTKLFYEAI